MHECADFVDSLHLFLPSKQRTAAGYLIDSVATWLRSDADTDVPLLTGRKHSRAFNFRKRHEQRDALFCVLPARKRARHGVHLLPTVEQAQLDRSREVDNTKNGECDANTGAQNNNDSLRNARGGSSSWRAAQAINLEPGVEAHYRQSNLCEPLPRSDYQTDDPNVFYVCYSCNEPVRSTEMIVEANGAFDAIFYHVACYDDHRLH